jgi:phenylglyoxylate dehydrogenase beta subunit
MTRPAENALPIDAYLEVLGKYRHLEPDQVAHIARTVSTNLGRIQMLAAVKGAASAAAGCA